MNSSSAILIDEEDFKRLLLGLPERECDGCGQTDCTVVDCYAEVTRTYQPPMRGLMEVWALCLHCRHEGFHVDEGPAGVASSLSIQKVDVVDRLASIIEGKAVIG